MHIDKIEAFDLTFGHFDDEVQGVELRLGLSGDFEGADPETIVRMMAALLARLPVKVVKMDDLRDHSEVVETFLQSLDKKKKEEPNGKTE